MTKQALATQSLPRDVQRLLVAIGGNKRLVRRRREYTRDKLAKLSRPGMATIARAEKGDSGSR